MPTNISSFEHQTSSKHKPSENCAYEKLAEPSASSLGRGDAYAFTRLNPLLSFDTIVNGYANELAIVAAQAILNNLIYYYNPLFVHGVRGAGKTHFLHAIGNEFFKRNSDMIVRYINAQDLVDELINVSMDGKPAGQLLEEYRSIDVLLIDDVHALKFLDKDLYQREITSLFEALIDARKQIVLSGNVFPTGICGLDAGLASLFMSGLEIQLIPPDFELRVAILRKMAELNGVALPDDVASLIADSFCFDIREMKGALKTITDHANTHGQTITIDVARRVLRNPPPYHGRPFTLEQIQGAVATCYEVATEDLVSARCSRKMARPRQIAMYLAKNLTSLPAKDIGIAFGVNRSATVLNACRLIDRSKNHDTDIYRVLWILHA